MRFLWFTFKWGLLAGVIGLAISVPYLYRRLDTEVCRRIEAKFAEHYRGLKVTLRSAELVKGEGIQVRGLSILDPAAQGPRAELCHVDEAFLTCCVDLDKLLTEEPEVTRVVVRRPVLRITRRRDGTWSTSQLLPLPKFGPHPPEVLVEGGTIEVFDPLKTPASTLTLRVANLRLRPLNSADPPGLDADTRHLEATLTGDMIQRVQLEGLLDTYNPRWEVRGTIEGLQVSPELCAALPGDLGARLAPLRPLRGSVNCGFRAAYDPAAQPPCRFDVNGQLTAGRWDDPRLPHPLTDLSAKLSMSHEGYSIENLSARSGQSTLRLSCRSAGYQPESPLAVSGKIWQLDLDPQLAQILPEPLRAQWSNYGLSGQVNAEVNLNFDGRTWHPTGSVECLKVSFSYHKFPYRIEYAKGRLDLDNDVLRLSVTGYSGSQPIHVSAEVRQPFSGKPYGSLKAEGNNVQIDEKLLAAIHEPSRSVVSSLEPRGTFNGALRIWRDRPDEPVHRHLLVALNRCWIQYNKFPYPLSVSHGILEMQDGDWSFRELKATNDTGSITCEGGLTRLADQERSELVLRFHGESVPLNEQLRDALRPDMQRFWTSLRPMGMVTLDVVVRYAGQSPLDVEVWAEPRGDSTSIEPTAFPYRMERLTGLMHYRGGHIDLEQFRAEHGNVRISADGRWDQEADGGWRLEFERLTADRVRPDRDLMLALPERLKRSIVALKLDSPINLSGKLALQRGPGANDPLTSQWDVGVNFAQSSLDMGFRLENVSGGARLVGGFDGQRASSRGELSIESLQWKNFQFTEVLGPVWIDDEQVLFGSWVDRRRHGPAEAARAPVAGQQPRPMTAQLLGGRIDADGWISLEHEPRYRIRANLVQADLARFAKENMAGQDLQGWIGASLELNGEGRSLNGLGGNGTLELRDADVYETPLMIRLLRLLSIHRPSTTAFSSCNVKYRIQGPHLYLDRIDFSGDAFSLIGQGDMNLQTELMNLVFHPQLGRGRLQMPLLQQVLGGAGRQLMLVSVTGTLQDPVVTRQALPGVNQAIQQFQGDLEKTTGQALFFNPQPVNRSPRQE